MIDPILFFFSSCTSQFFYSKSLHSSQPKMLSTSYTLCFLLSNFWWIFFLILEYTSPITILKVLSTFQTPPHILPLHKAYLGASRRNKISSVLASEIFYLYFFETTYHILLYFFWDLRFNLIKQIFVEHILYGRHCVEDYPSGQKRQIISNTHYK